MDQKSLQSNFIYMSYRQVCLLELYKNPEPDPEGGPTADG